MAFSRLTHLSLPIHPYTSCRVDATPKCCDFMRTGSAPFQTITVPMLGVLAILVPVMYVRV